MREICVSDQMLTWAEMEIATFKPPSTPVHEENALKRIKTNFICKAAIRYNKPEWSYKGRNFYTASNNWVYVKSSLCARPPTAGHHFFWVASEYERERKSVDYLMFTFTNSQYNKVWVAGYLSIKEFESRAKLIPANTPYSRRNGLTYTNKVDVYEVGVKDLNKV